MSDSAANISALSKNQIAALASSGFTAIDVSGGALSLSAAQFQALGGVLQNPAIARTVDGTSSNDIITFGQQPFSAADRINRNTGNDTLSPHGNCGSLPFNPDTISGIEKFDLNGGGGLGYDITEDDANLLAGKVLTVAASSFTATDSAVFDGSAETDASFTFAGGSAGSSTFTGGNRADTFNTGAGADTIRYISAIQSNSSAYDVVNGFDPSQDSFFWSQQLTFDGTVTGSLKTSTFENNLTSALAGVGANHAAILQATARNLQGQMFLLINDANAGYSPGDLIVRLANTNPATFSSNNFTHS